MKRKRFSEEQIIGILKESEVGAKTKDLCRKHGISDATFYNWKAKYAGMTVSEVRRLKELEAENSKLKRLLAEAELDKAALKDLLGRSKTNDASSYNIALLYNSLGEDQAALDWLEKAYEQRDPKMTLLKVEPKWNTIRTQARFVELMNRMKF